MIIMPQSGFSSPTTEILYCEIFQPGNSCCSYFHDYVQARKCYVTYYLNLLPYSPCIIRRPFSEIPTSPPLVAFSFPLREGLGIPTMFVPPECQLILYLTSTVESNDLRQDPPALPESLQDAASSGDASD